MAEVNWGLIIGGVVTVTLAAVATTQVLIPQFQQAQNAPILQTLGTTIASFFPLMVLMRQFF